MTTLNTVNTLMAELMNELMNENNKLRDSYINKRKAIELSYSILNDKVLPNVDYLGRLHAPIDGYAVDEKIYGKGEYLPIPDYLKNENLYFYENKIIDKYTLKIKVVEQVAAMLIDSDIVKFAGIKKGKLWQQNNNTFCYVYLTCNYKSIIKIIEKHITKILNILIEPTLIKKLLVDEGKQIINGKVLKVYKKEGFYGLEHKMLIELNNGIIIYGSIPKKIINVSVNDIVQFTATCYINNDKNYYSSPSKPIIIKKYIDKNKIKHHQLKRLEYIKLKLYINSIQKILDDNNINVKAEDSYKEKLINKYIEFSEDELKEIYLNKNNIFSKLIRILKLINSINNK